MSNTVINTNVMALNSHRALTSVGLRQARSSERLSTGMRINRASDDAAGLAISEKMRAQIRGLDQAERNSQDGISLVQIAEGALQEVQDVAQRMRELTVQAANDTLDEQDRDAIQVELVQLAEEIEAIIERTEFNGIPLLDSGVAPVGNVGPQNIFDEDIGLTVAERNSIMNFWDGQFDTPGDLLTALREIAGGAGMTDPNPAEALQDELWGFIFEEAWQAPTIVALQNEADADLVDVVDDWSAFLVNWANARNEGGSPLDNEIFIQNGSNAGQSLVLTLPNFNTTARPAGPLVNLINGDFELDDHASISASLNDIDDALNEVSTYRAGLGATQNRLEHTINNLQIASENTSAAESRIRDTDMAREMMAHTQANILQQASVSMLAQANQAPQAVLQLLQ